MKSKIIHLLGRYIRQSNNDALELLIKKHFPNGSGFDSGTEIRSASRDRVVFKADFHHMDESGGYSGWTEHSVIIRPDFECGYSIKVTGKDRNGVKEYIADTFCGVLNQYVWPIGFPSEAAAK